MNVPAVLAVAFNCTLERALPKTMSAGLLHVIVGVTRTEFTTWGFPVREPVLPLKLASPR